MLAHTHALRRIANDRRFITILLLGFSSGLPASLTASTLQAWFTDAGISLQTIGVITLLVLPYSLRFLWSPLFDYFQIPGFDRRRGWLLVTQLGLIATITWMALITPTQTIAQIPTLLIAGFITALLSASQDIVINAYQAEILPSHERGLGASIYVTGWRIGAIISGAVALVLANEIGWQQTYLFMATLVGIGITGTLIAPSSMESTHLAANLIEALIAPIHDFFERFGFKAASLFMLLIMSYKFGDALALALNTTFLMRHIGFDLSTIGYINKTVSLIAALSGGVVAGIAMTRISLYRALLLFGFIQGVANFSYVALAYYGKSYSLLAFSAFAENFCSGMGTIALMALLMSLCNKKYTATQFALFSAIAFLARTIVGPVAAIMVSALGWSAFFAWCFLFSMPTLAFVYANRDIIQSLKR